MTHQRMYRVGCVADVNRENKKMERGGIMSQRLLFKNKGECAGLGSPTAVTLEVSGGRDLEGGVPGPSCEDLEAELGVGDTLMGPFTGRI